MFAAAAPRFYGLNIKRRLIKVLSIAMETKNGHKKTIKIAYFIVYQTQSNQSS
jgi:hypothetical protein